MILLGTVMKIQQLLESDIDLKKELSQDKYKDYSDGIQRLLNNEWTLYRGSDYYDTSNIGIYKPRLDRKPANASSSFYYYAFKNLEPWKSLPLRSVICSTGKKYASGYGNLFYIIPKNGTTLCKLPDSDLWDSFDAPKHFGLKARYKNFDEITERLNALIKKLNDNIFIHEGNFMNALKIASDKLKIDDSMLWEYSMSLENTTLLDAVVNYFNIDIEIFNVENMSFENSSGSSNEVWFSSSYITIPYDMVGLYL